MASTAVLGMFSTSINLSATVTDCEVRVVDNVPTAPSTTSISIWNSVGVFLTSAGGNYVITDIPAASAVLDPTQRSIQTNHSTVIVRRCTVTRTSSLVSDVCTAGKLRLSVCVVGISNALILTYH
ncbi:Hypothetical protein, putative [Bodo saltans]|uniref:Uncharacterized protein n=1 Tax=Bodo saltans TaxID=75058 RepID=A0A0S4J1I3_BODSA|nr:Hypothetical protein, putative [Bodo saltans]|eukprot:CUG80581.1 Hypothetical protein, putative [Bodo saltans]